MVVVVDEEEEEEEDVHDVVLLSLLALYVDVGRNRLCLSIVALRCCRSCRMRLSRRPRPSSLRCRSARMSCFVRLLRLARRSMAVMERCKRGKGNQYALVH